jgi:hypothetical protein
MNEIKIRSSMAHKCKKCLLDYLINGQENTNESNAALMGTFIHEGFVSWYSKYKKERIIYKEKPIENEVFTGHIDGYLQKEKAIFELKTVSPFKYNKINEPVESHIIQTHLYMQMMNVKKTRIVYLNRDTGEFKEFEIKFNRLIYLAVEAKAKEAIELYKQGKKPDEIELNEFETCDQYCKFANKPLEQLPEGEKTSNEIEGITELYQTRMQLDNEIKDLTKTKKEIEENIKTLMLKSQAKKVIDLGINFIESERKTFDSKTFNKKYPELYQNFIKVSKSQYLKFKGA